MKRWNGWGDEKATYPLPEPAAYYLAGLIGEGEWLPDATLAQALAAVPESRLPEHLMVTREPLERLRHARGQSLPDWIALRSGRIGVFPDGVAYPSSEGDVRELLRYARQVEARLIPYGGGTSVVGHVNPLPGPEPVLTLDLSFLNQLHRLDETSHLATFGAGVLGPELEAQLQAQGYTLGHYPQSFEYSSLGGWIATRSSGQQSYYYGRIEELFAGGQVETPLGSLELPPLPASAAGPDLRQLVLGSEGRLGIITRATVRIRPRPEHEAFYGFFFHDWESGAAAVRQMAQERVPVSMVRLSDAQETETTLALAGHSPLLAWGDWALRLVRYGSERCLLLVGVTGDGQATRLARRQAAGVARAYGGLFTGNVIGRTWARNRFLAPYLRNTLWELGYAVDTLETAVPWARVIAAAAAIKTAIRDGLNENGERVLVFAHLSHVYADGASIYVTYLFRRAAGPEETLQRWQVLKAVASQAIVAHQGTISHQHGVGLDHAPYLAAEKGEVGMRWLAAVAQAADPHGLMNPEKLVEAVKV
ncbi:MAG: FAD-binding oxidoreductase [Chloroflexi bacterium]|nr:FAD-binding oxidoreductase [Chloroflexota bacterium]MCI0577656.1 FAD-binding oxidoreductase [Chloroflexota bacterium]MCI0644873.1 FAD-binding oxidoreductase [Chloroflexota bacterium]MCI0725829.1 FAD-binding oxidoreductase [Chloroflexota bacterium]